ncbi:uncharacterized protein N7482_008438 [Penicillium canariense]|uniref:Uncharacterized protein n=1 Tax=Penicillium canariense TaxID=189055 RepID=A0A9W9HV77_9EURO|nr:uncharacterized protein N7482_008438 [Penicillium canariense]KAJ5157338.1 hypothetical protein N7482_008438 [Penicillium canariense]
MHPTKTVFRLHLVRHAEGTHNPAHDTTIPDPPLTERGIEQSKELCRDFPFKQDVGLVITSPLRRTLQTTLVGFGKTLDKKYYSANQGAGVSTGAQLLAAADVQAHSTRPCDTGSDISLLHAEFPDLPWDTLGLDPVFPAKQGPYAPDYEMLRQRGLRIQSDLEHLFQELQSTGRPDVVIVTHGGFMRFITGKTDPLGPAKWRTFLVTFDLDSGMTAEPLLSG